VTKSRKTGIKDKRQKTKDKRQKTKDKRQKAKGKRQKAKDKRQKNSILQSILNHFYLLTFIFCLVTYLLNKQ